MGIGETEQHSEGRPEPDGAEQVAGRPVGAALLAPPHVGGAHGISLCPAHCEAEDMQAMRAVSLVRNVVSQVSALSWGLWQFQRCPPDSFAGILHNKPKVAQDALNLIRRQWEGVQKLERVTAAAALRQDLYWAGTNPLVHESMAICARHGWQITAEVKGMAYEQWAGISDTKRVLEDVFAALRVTAQRNKNNKLSRPHSFFEASIAKILHPVPTENGEADEDLPVSVTLREEDWQSPLFVPLKNMGKTCSPPSPPTRFLGLTWSLS